jgi:hypothetical protein
MREAWGLVLSIAKRKEILLSLFSSAKEDFVGIEKSFLF